MANSITHAALPYPIKGARYTIPVPYLDADGDPTDPTTPDTEISKDAGAYADCLEEVTTITGGNGSGYITLSGEELDCDMVVVTAKVASGPKATILTAFPRRLVSIGTGTLSAGSAGGGTLGTLITYDLTGCFIRTTGGTGGGGVGGRNNQARKIMTYNTGTGAFTVSPNWETTPSTDTTYELHLPEGMTLGMLKALNPTTAGRTLDVSTGGEAGLDWANIGSPTTVQGLSGTTIKDATDVNTDTDTLLSRMGTPSNLGGGATLSANLSDIESQTDDIGAAGAGLTAQPWNAAWDAEVQSEVDDALKALFLDRLFATDYDPGAKPGVATALLNELIESDAGVSRFTANALEQAPTGGTLVGVLANGTAQSGTASTITLQNDEPTTVDLFTLNGIRLTGGTGVGQSRIITDYTAGRVATVNEPWIVTPDNTTQYEVFSVGIAAASVEEVAQANWAALRADNNVAGSFGEYVFADALRFSGNASAADASETFFTNGVLALSNITIGTVSALTGHTAQTGDAFARLGAPAGASVSADIAAVKAQAVAIEADTNALQVDWADGGRLDNILDARASQASVNTLSTDLGTLATTVGTVNTNVSAIKVKTDQMVFEVSGLINANPKYFNNNPIAGGGAVPWRRG